MINNFLKAVGASDNSRQGNESSVSKSASAATSASAVTVSAATAAATALDVGENLAHTIGGWLNFQEGKFGQLKNGSGSVGGRYYYEDKLVRFILAAALILCLEVLLCSMTKDLSLFTHIARKQTETQQN